MAYFNLFIGANIADIISTYAALNTGAGVEANPFIHNVMQTTSIPEALALKFILAAGVAVLLKTRKPRLLVIPTLVFALVAISNSLIGLSVF